MRSLLLTTLASLLLVPACTTPTSDTGGAADIQGEDTKADGTVGIEVTARIAPGAIDTALTAATPRLGYVFYADESTHVTLEVTHGGTQAGVDTLLKVYGPRLGDGSYPKTLGADEDSGYGKLSKLNVQIPISGFYLVELANGANAAPVTADEHVRLQLTCKDGSCVTDAPIQPLTEDIKWYQRAAERHAAQYQAFGLASSRLAERASAGLPLSWGVVLDVDETTLNNSAYQRSRQDLGVGYSPNTWTAWVNQRAATATDGVVAFTDEVRTLGGKVILVTNRKAATECSQTEDNLHAVGVTYDAIYCQVDVSDKNPRFAAIAAGTAAGLPATEVVMFVGDNILDFPALTQDLRTQPASAFDQFGEKFILIPNPMYGSFDKNLD